MVVIGIDCATDPKKAGLTRANYDTGTCALTSVEFGSTRELLAHPLTKIQTSCFGEVPRSSSSAPRPSCGSERGRSTRSLGCRRSPGAGALTATTI